MIESSSVPHGILSRMTRVFEDLEANFYLLVSEAGVMPVVIKG